MRVLEFFLDLLFPPKCILCSRLLQHQETDLCKTCRLEAPTCSGRKKSISFVMDWTAVYYYEGTVRESLLRYKFGGRQHYAAAYGRLLAARISEELHGEFDLLTYVPVSTRRRLRRGYDQVLLLAKAVGRELGIVPVPVLQKVRHNAAQSSLQGPEQRHANVLGAYRVSKPERLVGRRVLLLDDIITTGATLSECARVLRTAGASQVVRAAVAAHREKPR